MDLSPRGMKMLFEFEGRHKRLPDGRYRAYRCPANVPTIYAGLTRGIKDGMIVTEEEGERLLRRELVGFEDAVERLVKVPMTQPMFDALVLLAFNIGLGAFQKSTLLKLLNQGKIEQAAAQFSRWNKGGGRVLPGLVRRRKAEAALFLEPGEHEAIISPPEDEEGEMPQAVEPTRVPFTEGAGKSPSVLSALGGLVSSIGVAWNWLWQAASETTKEVATAKTSLNGFEALWSHLNISLGGVLLAVTVGSLAVVLVRQIQRYSEGRG